MPAISPYIIEPIWQQLSALLPRTQTDHPLGCHRPRIPDRVVFEKLVQLLSETLDTTRGLPERASIHLDRAYDSKVTTEILADRDLIGVISKKKGKPAPLKAGMRWIVERTNSWHNAHKKLLWCTEREGRVIDFWVAFSNVVILVRRLIRKAWSLYRWESRPSRRP